MLDRKIQLGILTKLSETYPSDVSPEVLFRSFGEAEVAYNLAYLDDHGLTRSNWTALINRPTTPIMTNITAKGLDFLQDDGGLSAILGVVTVKLHEDTIKELLIKKVEQSSAEPTVKKKLIDQIKSLPAEMTKVATVEGLKAGIDSLPDVIQWLHKSLGIS